MGPLKDLNGKELDIAFELKRTWGGYLLERIIDEFQQRIDCEGKEDCSYLKYSAESAVSYTLLQCNYIF